MANQLGGFFVCERVPLSSGSGFHFSKVKHSGVNIRLGAAGQRHVGALACQCCYVCIRVRVVVTLGQRRSSFVTTGVVGVVDGVHQVGLDGVIRDTKIGQCSGSGGRVTLVGLQDVGNYWVALHGVGDDIPCATCAIRTASDWATGNNAKRSRLCDFFGNVTSLVELVQLAFQCGLSNTLFTTFGQTFFDGDLGAGLGKVTEGLQRIAQARARPAQNCFFKGRATNTHRHGSSSRSNKRLALCNLHGNLVCFRWRLTHFDCGSVRFVVRARRCTTSGFGNVCGNRCSHTCGSTHLGGNRLAILQRKRSTFGTRCGNAADEKRCNFLDTFNANVFGQELKWGRLKRAVDGFKRTANTLGIANHGLHVFHRSLILRSITCFAKIIQRI